jgi:hypothetical protein
MPLPQGMKQYTKNRGITDSEFEPMSKWFKNKKVSNNENISVSENFII